MKSRPRAAQASLRELQMLNVANNGNVFADLDQRRLRRV
jgi:hypothetical protein